MSKLDYARTSDACYYLKCCNFVFVNDKYKFVTIEFYDMVNMWVNNFDIR